MGKKLPKPKWMKPVAMGAGVFLVLFVAAAIIVPLVVDVDKYRSTIEELVESHINGDLELGKLKLSLWGRILIKVEHFTLSDRNKKKIISAKNVYFHIPITSLLSGSPAVTFKLKSPELHIVKLKSGKYNLMTLVKESKGKPKASKQSEPVELPAFAKRSRLNMDLRDALLVYRDLTTKEETKIKDINIKLTNLSLTHPTKLSMWGNIDTETKGYTIKGPVKLNGTSQVSFKKGQFQKANLKLNVDLNKLYILIPDTFKKTQTNYLNAELTMQVGKNSLSLEALNLKVFNSKIQMKGKVVSFTKPNLTFDIQSEGIDLDPMLIPASKQSKTKKPVEQSDYDALLAPLRKSKMASAAKGTISFSVKYLRAMNFELTDITGKARLNNLKIKIDPLKLKLYDAPVTSTLSANLNPRRPTYRFNMKLASLDLSKAVDAQVPAIAGMVKGTASFNLKGSGASFNPNSALQNLKGQGGFKMVNLSLKAPSEDANEASAAINDAYRQISGKVAGVQVIKVDKARLRHLQYDEFSSSIVIGGGRLSTPNIVATAKKDLGIDMTGKSDVTLSNYGLDAKIVLVDTYNIIGAQKLAITSGGNQKTRLLTQSDGYVHLPLSIGGTVFEPEVNYAALTGNMVAVAVRNIVRSTASIGAAGINLGTPQIKKDADKKAKEAEPNLGKEVKKLFGF